MLLYFKQPAQESVHAMPSSYNRYSLICHTYRKRTVAFRLLFAWNAESWPDIFQVSIGRCGSRNIDRGPAKHGLHLDSRGCENNEPKPFIGCPPRRSTDRPDGSQEGRARSCEEVNSMEGGGLHDRRPRYHQSLCVELSILLTYTSSSLISSGRATLAQ